MFSKRLMLLLAAAAAALVTNVAVQGQTVQIPKTSFTCQGRPSGYYADVQTGCQVYHMCDGLGRQFSYVCPNTTLFQQRMLICDHWYMVNCSKSERDYDANLLIGQRDKPFVSEADMRQRTPRPDILSVPPNNNYYDGLKEAESKYFQDGDNSIDSSNDGKQSYRPPTSWSTGINANNQRPSKRPSPAPNTQDNIHSASHEPSPTLPTTAADNVQQNLPNVTPPSNLLVPPFENSPSTTEPPSDDYDIDVRMRTRSQDPVFDFIKRFDPNSPTAHRTAMTQSEIINLNKHLPAGQTSSEEERTPRKQNTNGNFNTFQDFGKGTTQTNRFDSVNVKFTNPTESTAAVSNVKEPARELLPPKNDYSQIQTTTVGPPVYYEWKWAVPAFDLEPPKESNVTANVTNDLATRVTRTGNKFSNHRTTTTEEPELKTSFSEYNTSSYFVPDYVFPLDKPHPGYENENALTSFQVDVNKPERKSFGENPACPHCHPAYVKPGTCEPCIVQR